MKSLSNEPPYRNMLLSSLSANERKRLEPHLVPVVLRQNQTLADAEEPVETVYFLEEGICSVVANLENGNTVEVGIIGRDSFVGLPVVLGTGSSVNRSFMQIGGSGYSIKAKALQQHFLEDSGELHQLMLRGIQGMLVQTAQTAACNRVHELEERLSRWLLMCHERTQNDFLPITHEFLATMLGTRRSTVTVAAGMLHKSGLIEYARGHVRIINRAGLEDVACECYRIIRNEYIRLGLLN